MNPVRINSLDARHWELQPGWQQQGPGNHIPSIHQGKITKISLSSWTQFTHFACVAHLKVSFKIALCKTPSHLPLASYSPEIISFKRALPVRGVAQESHEVWNKPHRHGSLQSFAHQSDEPAFQRGSAYYRPPLTHTAHEHSKGGADARDRDRGPLSQTWICSVICFGSKSSFSQWCLLF